MNIGPAVLILFHAYRWTGRLNLIGTPQGCEIIIIKKKGNETDWSNSR
jgi:hypothetical protein